MASEIVSVGVRIGGLPYETLVRAGPHSFTADVDATKGGDDAGPDPHQLLLASLGACTVMTVKMYADRKGWPVTGVRATASHELLRDDEGPTHRFLIELTIDGDLSDEQRSRLMEISHRCPVHRALVERKSIEIRG